MVCEAVDRHGVVCITVIKIISARKPQRIARFYESNGLLRSLPLYRRRLIIYDLAVNLSLGVANKTPNGG